MAEPFSGPFPGPVSGPFSAESRLVHAGTERTPGRPAAPPPAQPAADLITDIDHALEVL